MVALSMITSPTTRSTVAFARIPSLAPTTPDSLLWPFLVYGLSPVKSFMPVMGATIGWTTFRTYRLPFDRPAFVGTSTPLPNSARLVFYEMARGRRTPPRTLKLIFPPVSQHRFHGLHFRPRTPRSNIPIFVCVTPWNQLDSYSNLRTPITCNLKPFRSICNLKRFYRFTFRSPLTCTRLCTRCFVWDSTCLTVMVDPRLSQGSHL